MINYKMEIKEWLANKPDRFISAREFVSKVGRLYVHLHNIETGSASKMSLADFIVNYIN